MNYNKLIFWLVFIMYWGDDYNCENIPIQENIKSTFTLLSESISEAVNNDSKYFN